LGVARSVFQDLYRRCPCVLGEMHSNKAARKGHQRPREDNESYTRQVDESYTHTNSMNTTPTREVNEHHAHTRGQRTPRPHEEVNEHHAHTRRSTNTTPTRGGQRTPHAHEKVSEHHTHTRRSVNTTRTRGQWDSVFVLEDRRTKGNREFQVQM
jgi:hypothetical protein